MSNGTDPISALTQIEPLAEQIQALAQAGLAWQPPTPPLNAQSWWVPKPGKFVRPCFVRLLPDGRLADYFVKQPQGWPMDIKVADESGIFNRYTDYPGAGSASAYRLYTNVNAESKCLGLKIANRYYDPAQGRIQVAAYPAVSMEKHTDCNTFTTNQFVAETWMSMWTAVDFGGDLGVQDSLVSEFLYWAGPKGFRIRELFFTTEDSGWADWHVQALQPDGSYKDSQPNTLHNMFIPDTLQVPVVPCDIVL